MAVIRTSSGKTDANNSIATLINNQNWSIDYINASSNPKIFNRGGGTHGHADHSDHNGYNRGFGGAGRHRGMGYPDVTGFGEDYGAWTLIPSETFEARTRMWGGGGGSHNHGANDPRPAGGGGFASAIIRFEKDIPYVIWVGQGGTKSTHNHNRDGGRRQYRQSATFGNGGNGAPDGGSGGGLSGIFFNTLSNDAGAGGGHSHGHANNTEYGVINSIFRSPAQTNSLLIAGGGGGAGHSSTNHHGQGGGGGGTSGQGVHNAGGGTQNAGGTGGYGSGQAGQRLAGGYGGSNSHGGGGGGGWWGGGGGGHSSNHHNGGGGGSGHSHESTVGSGYLNDWINGQHPGIVRDSYLEASGSNHGSYHNLPAARGEADWGHAGVGAGYGSDGGNFMLTMNSWSNTRNQGTNGRVVIEVI